MGARENKCQISKRRKLGVFIIFQKCQIVHPKFATNSSIFFIFNFWSREMSRDLN